MILMILAAGLGSRLAPLTKHRPKPLIPFQQKPLLHHHIEKAIAANFSKIIINTCHGPLIKNHLQALSYPIEIKVVEEPYLSPLDTAYGITNALPWLGDEPFALISGDIYSNYDYSSLKNLKINDGHLILVRGDSCDFDLKNGTISGPGLLTYANIGVFAPAIFKNIRSKKSLGQVIRSGGQYSGELFNGIWLNVGTFKELLQESK